METNRALLRKADLAISDLTTDGGLLVDEQAAKFIRILIKEAVLMKQATVTPMKSHKKLIEKIRFGSRILRAGTSKTALPEADRSKPDLSKVELDAKLFKAEVRLDDETIEDNIERQQLRQTIMELMGGAISRDMEEILVQGDTASSDLFLKVFDGLLKQATSHVVDAGTVNLDKTTLRDVFKAMPQEFRRDKRLLRFFTSGDAEVDYRDSLIDRMTAVGDKHLETDAMATYGGIPVEDVPLFPEDLGGGSNTTNILLVDPKNINVGIWRNIRMETDKDISEGVVKIVATLRFDVKFAHEPAVVKATNVKVT